MTTRAAFYFDPACPWAWVTSLWAREVQKVRPVEFEWKFFSLAEVNELEPERNTALRVIAQARREGGNEAVGLAYLAIGRAFHEDRIDRGGSPEDIAEGVKPQLEAIGLDPAIADRALSDDSTLEEVLSEHRESVEKYNAFGVPWIVLDGEEHGFFGPVIGEKLEGEAAGELWDHFTWLDTQPYLYELKRGRAKLPPLAGLSAGLGERQPVTS